MPCVESVYAGGEASSVSYVITVSSSPQVLQHNIGVSPVDCGATVILKYVPPSLQALESG